MGHDWHPECFHCTECHIPLSPDNFFEKNGKPYCENDFHKLFSPKCCACNLPIKEKVTFLLNLLILYFWLIMFRFFSVACVRARQRVASKLFRLLTSTMWQDSWSTRLWCSWWKAILQISLSGNVLAQMFRLQKANHGCKFFLSVVLFNTNILSDEYFHFLESRFCSWKDLASRMFCLCSV